MSPAKAQRDVDPAALSDKTRLLRVDDEVRFAELEVHSRTAVPRKTREKVTIRGEERTLQKTEYYSGYAIINKVADLTEEEQQLNEADRQAKGVLRGPGVLDKPGALKNRGPADEPGALQ